MVVAVDADFHDAGCGEGVDGVELVPQARAVGHDAVSGLAEGGRQAGEPRREGVECPSELGLHRVAPADCVVRGYRLGGEGMAGRRRGERPVETSGEGA